MPTFNKSRGFKLKSGNTVSFKEIGSSPVQQQADATLVGAARAAAMANVPKDLSAQYNKTAEGVIAANKGKTEMLTTLAKEAPGILTAVGRGIQKGVGKFKAKSKARKADVGFQDAKAKVKNIKDVAKTGKKATKEQLAEQGLTKKDMKNYKKEQLKIHKADKKAQRKRVNKEWKETGSKDFETAYQEEHKDRKSIADIRKMTGADGSVADKDRDFKKEYEQDKYRKKLQKKKLKGKVNGKDNGKGNDTIKLNKADLSKGLADSNEGSGGFGTNISQY